MKRKLNNWQYATLITSIIIVLSVFVCGILIAVNEIFGKMGIIITICTIIWMAVYIGRRYERK